jgi:hypothetical protein
MRAERACEARQASLLPTDRNALAAFMEHQNKPGGGGGSNHASSLRDGGDARRLGCAQFAAWAKPKRASAARARRCAPRLTYAADAMENVVTERASGLAQTRADGDTRARRKAPAASRG